MAPNRVQTELARVIRLACLDKQKINRRPASKRVFFTRLLIRVRLQAHCQRKVMGLVVHADGQNADKP